MCLEHRLALELCGLRLIEKINPVMIGEVNSQGDYNRFTHLTDVSSAVVDSVEVKVREHLARQAMGEPLRHAMTVVEVYDEIMANQRIFVQGNKLEAFNKIADSIVKML